MKKSQGMFRISEDKICLGDNQPTVWRGAILQEGKIIFQYTITNLSLTRFTDSRINAI